MEKEFIFEVSGVVEDIADVSCDELDWEFRIPVDFFPDPLHLDVGDRFTIKTVPIGSIGEQEFGGLSKKERSRKFR